MNTTPGTAANSDARKRIEDAMNTIRDGLRDAVENMDMAKIEAFLAVANPAPAPAEPEPVWAVISEDPERPTLARVQFDYGDDGETVTGYWHRRARRLYCERGARTLEYVTDVTLLHTYDPAVSVVVPRELVDEAALCDPVGFGHDGYVRPAKVIRALAALAAAPEKEVDQ